MLNGTEEARQQFGERIPNAMKLLEKAARNAGYKFDDFNKAMTKGMFKPAVLMKEVGKLMGEMANDNGALAKSLETSAVKQQQFTNAMKAFAGALLKSGLDQILTDLFNTLTGIVKVLSPLVMWLAKGVSGVIAFSKAHKGVAATVGIITFAFIALRSQILKTLATHVATMAMMVTSTYLASGAVGVLRLAFVALKGAIAATGIGLLLVGLVEAGVAYNDYLKGSNNWVATLMEYLAILGSEFDKLGARATLAFDIMRGGGNSSKWAAFTSYSSLGKTPEIVQQEQETANYYNNKSSMQRIKESLDRYLPDFKPSQTSVLGMLSGDTRQATPPTITNTINLQVSQSKDGKWTANDIEGFTLRMVPNQ